jgi:hypothetical protein
MQSFLVPLDRAAKLAFAGAGAHLRYPGKLLSPKPTPGKLPGIAYGCKHETTQTGCRYVCQTGWVVVSR